MFCYLGFKTSVDRLYWDLKKRNISASIWDFRRICRQYLGLQKDVQMVFWTSEGCADSILDFRRMCRQYFGLQKDVQTVFWTSEGCADSILDFRRMCRQYFGLQKDVQTIFWTSEGCADSILDFRRMCRQYFGLQKDVQTVFWTSESIFRWHHGPQKCLGVGFLASEKSYIDSIIMDLTLCHRVYYGLNTLPQSC